MNPKQHWEEVYTGKSATDVSWWRPHLTTSVRLIQRAAPNLDAQIIDVGGGTSTLVDDLLELGYQNVTVLDISEAALESAMIRLGHRAKQVTWVAADVTQFKPPSSGYDIWHDRAVFHFLTRKGDRRRYVQQVVRTVRPGGHVIVATFGPKGPERCSGLDIVRYDAQQLHGEFGSVFVKEDSLTEMHTTPWGTEQEFVYCCCLKRE